MRKWRIEDSAELYNVKGWGRSYFSINEKGHVQVTPKEGYAAVDVKDVLDELQLRDITPPVLLRFPDILDNRIEKISKCFKQASEEYKYKAQTHHHRYYRHFTYLHPKRPNIQFLFLLIIDIHY